MERETKYFFLKKKCDSIWVRAKIRMTIDIFNQTKFHEERSRQYNNRGTAKGHVMNENNNPLKIRGEYTHYIPLSAFHSYK